ncbi:MAG TPA: hypothetical protein VKA26_01180 [Ignavibacteriaceae bacterium]|nr:hypothetical protein [Ignavibacteriaceae bacterium]
MSDMFSNTSAVSEEDSFMTHISDDYRKKGDELLRYSNTELLTIKDIPESASPNKAFSESINKKHIFKLNKNITVNNTIFIKDEQFFIELKDNFVTINHPIWSLIGQGENLYEAMKDFMILAYEVFISLADDKPSELTEDANNLRNFLFKVF